MNKDIMNRDIMNTYQTQSNNIIDRKAFSIFSHNCFPAKQNVSDREGKSGRDNKKGSGAVLGY